MLKKRDGCESRGKKIRDSETEYCVVVAAILITDFLTVRIIIIIFIIQKTWERKREEKRKGFSTSLADGYKRSFLKKKDV